MAIADAAGFMFDLDGTLVHRAPDGVVALPGAAEVLAAIRSSGRPLVVFTNASDSDPGAIAERLRRGGLELEAEEVLTAACSALGRPRHERAVEVEHEAGGVSERHAATAGDPLACAARGS